LPAPIYVVDHSHAIKLANAAVDDIRRRVQQETLGHRTTHAAAAATRCTVSVESYCVVPNASSHAPGTRDLAAAGDNFPTLIGIVLGDSMGESFRQESRHPGGPDAIALAPGVPVGSHRWSPRADRLVDQ
jgi:hypothetical protein